MDYHKILGVSSNATNEELKNSFVELIKKYKDQPKKKKQIIEAYKQLKNQNMKQIVKKNNNNQELDMFGSIMKQHNEIMQNFFSTSSINFDINPDNSNATYFDEITQQTCYKNGKATSFYTRRYKTPDGELKTVRRSW